MKDTNLVLIDADSIIYIVGYKNELLQLESVGIMALDDFIKDILITTGSKEYIGFYGDGSCKNYRHDIAVTKPYKGNRSEEKPEWFDFWAPILKKRMKEYWGFQGVGSIEADDAVSIAAQKYNGKYKKVIVSTPDKDLFQIPDMNFYNYDKRMSVYCDATVARQLLAKQLILGDSTDNIAGLPGAGKKAAEDFIAEAVLKDVDLIEQVKDKYKEWFQVTLSDKLLKKQQKEYLDQYKVDNDIKVLRKAVKSEALKEFKFDSSEVLTDEQVEDYFNEMYGLIKLLDTEDEGKVFDFECIEPTVDNKVDWENVIMFQDELDALGEEDEIEFEELI